MSTKYILAGGYIQKAFDGGRAFCDEMIKSFDVNKKITILDCLFGQPQEFWDEKFVADKLFFSTYIPECNTELASPEIFLEQVKNADIIFFQGGTPHQLISLLGDLNEFKLCLDGKILVGTSGGADTICTYYGVGKTGDIGQGLGLVPAKFIPHWKSDYGKGLDIDWDTLLQQLRQYKEDLPIYTIAEGEFMVIVNNN